MATDGDITRLHGRLDDLFSANTELQKSTAAIQAVTERIEERCIPCQEKVKKHEVTLYGNGRNGLTTRIAATETGRVDTLSVKGVIALVGAIGALAATIGAAMGAMMR